jgi:hypothetical protein
MRKGTGLMRKVTLNDVTLPSVNKSESAIQVLARALKMKVLMSSMSNDSLAGSFLQNRDEDHNEEEQLNSLVSFYKLLDMLRSS